MGRGMEHRERSAWSNVLITAVALVASWATIELAFKPYLAAGRAAIDRDLDPDYDPDSDLDENSRPPSEEAKDASEDVPNENQPSNSNNSP